MLGYYVYSISTNYVMDFAFCLKINISMLFMHVYFVNY